MTNKPKFYYSRNQRVEKCQFESHMLAYCTRPAGLTHQLNVIKYIRRWRNPHQIMGFKQIEPYKRLTKAHGPHTYPQK
uniref:Uncharacterized protein n=1 Tax=Rhizophora mucronata TaxID=61149 RepID=A0A2P2N397_RHIMU